MPETVSYSQLDSFDLEVDDPRVPFVEFFGKAEWEGGFMEVAEQWSDLVPESCREEAQHAVAAVESFRQKVIAEALAVGVEY